MQIYILCFSLVPFSIQVASGVHRKTMNLNVEQKSERLPLETEIKKIQVENGSLRFIETLHKQY